mmetsp:Transcript_6053/g.19000  ORF Transcript_6053/g.19000 Transcript_6053/m.19000 type:complete len:324 (-) Transcript_6053:178-1149(-)
MVFVSSKGNQKSLSMTFPVALSTPTAALMWMYDKSESFTISFLYSFGSSNVLFSSSSVSFSLLCFSFCAALRSTSAGNTKFTLLPSSSSSSSSLFRPLLLLLLLNLDLPPVVVNIFSGTLLIPSAFALNVMLVTIPRPRITSIGSLFPVANMTLISGFPMRFESDRGVINSSVSFLSTSEPPFFGVIGSAITSNSSSSCFSSSSSFSFVVPSFVIVDDEAFVLALLILNALNASTSFLVVPLLLFTLKPCTRSVGSLLAELVFELLGERMRSICVALYSSVVVILFFDLSLSFFPVFSLSLSILFARTHTLPFAAPRANFLSL